MVSNRVKQKLGNPQPVAGQRETDSTRPGQHYELKELPMLEYWPAEQTLDNKRLTMLGRVSSDNMR